MEKFKFNMNGLKNVCYVYTDTTKPAIDTLHLIETKDDDTGNLEKGWIPQTYFVQRLLCDFNEDLEAVKEFYNENYEEICENLFPEDLLKMPEVINGFYLNRETGEIDKAASVLGEDRFGVAGSHDQAKGIAALCTLSHILPIYNQGWKPDWSTNKDKWYLQRFNYEVKVTCSYNAHHFLTFETKEKAEFFLKEKINLIVDLSNAGFL